MRLLLPPLPELDYQIVIDAFKNYAYPRKALSDALVRGDLVRVKKGLYVQSGHGIPAYSREVLANMIYGPSYISFEYALAYYGLIPERVEEISSATLGKSKAFATPAGKFSYTHVSTSYYSFGFAHKLLGEERDIPYRRSGEGGCRPGDSGKRRVLHARHEGIPVRQLANRRAWFPESRQKRTRRGIATVRQTVSWAAAEGQGWSIVKTPLDNLLSRYTLTTTEESLQALREITQEIALLGLWRGKFFEHAAFYGGSALRIVDGLPRYSEDLDFSLLVPNPGFKVQSYFAYVEKELRAFGFDVSIVQRPQNKGSAIDGAFVKMNTREGFLTLGVPRPLVDRLSREQVLKIKFEIDIDPPGDFRTETKYQYMPQAEYLTGLHGSAPVLLIDDVMGELDVKRRSGFLPLLEQARKTGGQVFMTATEENWPSELEKDLQRWEVQAGTLLKK